MNRLEICFEVSDVILRGDLFPSGKDRVVILVHGGGQARDSWGGIAAGLQRSGWDVVAMDLRGHGGSGWSRDGDYSIHKFSSDLVEVARKFKRPHIVGAYLGGLVAFTALLDGYGSLFGKVLMIDAVPLFSPSNVRMIMGRMGRETESSAKCSGLAPDGSCVLEATKTKFPRERKNYQLGAEGRPEWRWDPVLVAALEKGRTRYTRRQFDCRLANVVNPIAIIVGAYSNISETLIRELLEYNIRDLEIINISQVKIDGECVNCTILRELAKILEPA